MTTAIVLLNYPLQNQIEVGHIDLLRIQFENMLNLFDKVHVISPRDARTYNLGWDPRIIIHTTGCMRKATYYMSPLSDLYYILRLIKKNNVGVIRALAHSSGFIAVLASKLTGVPAVVSIHCDRKLVAEKEGESKFKHWLLALTDAWTYKNATIVPVISKYIDKCVKKVCPKTNTFLHHNFVDTTIFKPQKHKNKVPVLVFVGRLAKVNGADSLLRAMPRILAKKNVVLKICGSGPERLNLEKLAENLRVTKSVIFLGSLDHNTILSKEMSSSDIFVSPAVSGFSLIEALACGLPIAAVDTEWSKEVVTKSIGKLVKHSDHRTLASGILEVLSKRFKIDLGGNSRMLALERFNITVWMAREAEIYKNVLSN